MKKYITLTAIAFLSMTSIAFAKEHIVKQVSSEEGKYYFAPNTLTVEIGDTVTFENAQDDLHDVMFVKVPKAVNETIMSPMSEKKGDKFSYTFKQEGTYEYHCHPHETFGMKGTIIVGKPSKAEDTKGTTVHDHGGHH